MLPETILKRSEGTLSTEADDESVLMSIETGKYYTLDPVGSAVWRLLADPTTFSELTERLADCFEGDLDQILSESEAYLKELAARNLVVQS